MKKFWLIVSIWCMLLLLGCGVMLLFFAPKDATYSASENRMLEPFPEVGVRSLLSGEFSVSFENWLSDRFFGRDRWIAIADRIDSRLSLLSNADRVKLAAMDTQIDETEAEPSDALPPSEETTPSIAPSAAPTPAPVPERTSAPSKDAMQPVTVLTHTPAPSMTRTPLLDYDKAKDTDKQSFAAVKLIRYDGSEEQISKYQKWHIRHAASQFNRLAALLPKGGHMYVALTQRSEHVIQYSAALDKYKAYVSEAEDYLEPLLDERISVFRTMDILEPHIRAGEYVYLKTDHHWTIRGAYYLHQAMIEAQGLKAVPFEDYRITRQPGTFTGLNYKIVADLLPPDTTDYVEMVEPGIPYRFYRVNDIDTLTEYPLNNPDEQGYQAILWLNMRPWKMIRTYQNTGRKMLLICDSMGMAFAPFMANYYDEVHVVRPHETYYSAAQAGGTIKEYIDHYGIDDIYVVQGAFFTADLYRKTLDVSIGDGK